MKVIFLCIYFAGAYIYTPDNLSGQESLLIKTIQGRSKAINSVAFSPDGKYGASGGVDNTLKIWRLEDGMLVKTLEGHTNSINSVAFSPDGNIIASASADNTVKIWKVETGSCMKTFNGHTNYVWSAAFFPDGEQIASGSDDGTIQIWHIASKTRPKTLKGYSGYVYSVSISSDGKYLASGNASTTVKIWNVKSGLLIRTLEGHDNYVNSVAFSPNGNYIASGSDDGTVKIWRLEDGICVKTFAGHKKAVTAVSYSPDGTYLVSGSSDKTIKVWSIAQGVLTRTLEGHKNFVKSISISPDGKYLVSGSFDKALKLWLTPWEAERRDNEIKKAEEMKIEKKRMEDEKTINHNLHYNTGLQLLSSPTMSHLKTAIIEFEQALSYKQTKESAEKLKEAGEALHRKKQERKLIAIISAGSLLLIFLLRAIGRAVSGARKKTLLRKTLPDAIKRETLSGNHENAFNLYAEYKAVGGKTQNLPRQELLELYRGVRALDDLPKEDIPYDFLLSYAVTIAEEGNYKVALSMLRSGRLLDELKKPEEYDAFAGIYEKAGRPENLLLLKFKAVTYTGLAEAFFKIKNYDCGEKMCALKKQFYAKEISSRDNELLSACQKERIAAGSKPPL